MAPLCSALAEIILFRTFNDFTCRYVFGSPLMAVGDNKRLFLSAGDYFIAVFTGEKDKEEKV